MGCVGGDAVDAAIQRRLDHQEQPMPKAQPEDAMLQTPAEMPGLEPVGSVGFVGNRSTGFFGTINQPVDDRPVLEPKVRIQPHIVTIAGEIIGYEGADDFSQMPIGSNRKIVVGCLW